MGFLAKRPGLAEAQHRVVVPVTSPDVSPRSAKRGAREPGRRKSSVTKGNGHSQRLQRRRCRSRNPTRSLLPDTGQRWSLFGRVFCTGCHRKWFRRGPNQIMYTYMLILNMASMLTTRRILRAGGCLASIPDNREYEYIYRRVCIFKSCMEPSTQNSFHFALMSQTCPPTRNKPSITFRVRENHAGTRCSRG